MMSLICIRQGWRPGEQPRSDGPDASSANSRTESTNGGSDGGVSAAAGAGEGTIQPSGCVMAGVVIPADMHRLQVALSGPSPFFLDMAANGVLR